MISEYNEIWENPDYYSGVSTYLKEIPEEKKTIFVLIENEYNDRIFWNKLFTSIPSKYNFRIDTHKYTGSTALIQLAKNGKLNACRVICIDSDYKYLLDDDIIKNKFVFHTYTHSIENHFCFGKNLHYYCEQVSTLSVDDYFFDFESFLSNYSKIVYDTFVCLFCRCSLLDDCKCFDAKRNYQYLYFSPIITNLLTEYEKKIKNIRDKYKSESKKYDEINRYSKDFIGTLSDTIIRKFKEKHKYIRLCNLCNETFKNEAKLTLEGKGVTNNNLYLFVRGHTLYDNGIKQLIKLIIKLLENIKVSQIFNQCQHKTFKENRSEFYNHYNSYKPHNVIFPQGLNQECEFVENIRNDIRMLYIPKVMISYSHKDKSDANRLAIDLQQNNIDIKLDDKDMLVGESIHQWVEKNLTECDYILVLLSHDSIESSWVKEEINAARMREKESNKSILLSVMLNGITSKDLPLLLKDKNAVSLCSKYEDALKSILRSIREYEQRSHINNA